MRKILSFLNEFNTTSSRIIFSLILSFLTGIRVLFLSSWMGQLDLQILIAWCAFVATLGGLDVVQFTQKRKTFIPETPPGTNVEKTVANRVVGDEYGVEFTE